MDDMNEDLGPAEAWQIKQFPRTLREDLIRAAREHQMTVGEMLTRIVLAARGLNWKMPEGNAGPTLDPRRLERAVGMATSAAGAAANMPKGIARLAWQLVKAEMKTLKQQSTAQLPMPLKGGASRPSRRVETVSNLSRSDDPKLFDQPADPVLRSLMAHPELREVYVKGAQMAGAKLEWLREDEKIATVSETQPGLGTRAES